jgi:hypothetical protein
MTDMTVADVRVTLLRMLGLVPAIQPLRRRREIDTWMEAILALGQLF